LQQVGRDSHFWLGDPIAPVADPTSAKPAPAAASQNLRIRRPKLSRKRLRGLTVAAAALAGAMVFTVLSDGGRNIRVSSPVLPKLDTAAAMVGLGVDQVAITGQKFTSDGDIFEALQLENARSFASLDAEAAKERIEELPWVQSAEISRVYPARLDIRVTERKPWAVWRQAAGQEVLIDASGRVLAAIKAGTPSVGLPRFAGAAAAKEAPGLMALLERYPDVRQQLEEAERVADRRWTLRLKGGITLVLPTDREAQALSLYASDRTVKALTAGGGYEVDLRGVNKITLRKSPVASDGASQTAPSSTPADARS
jgi:cell division protein FtsQ